MKFKNLNNKMNVKSDVAKLSQKWLDVLIPFSYELKELIE